MLLLHYTLFFFLLSLPDEPLQNSTLQPRRFFGDVASVGSPPSALPALNQKAFESSDSPGAQQPISKPSHNVMATDSIQFKWRNVETSRPLKAISLPEADSHPLSKLSLNPSKPVLGANLQIGTTATLISDWQLAGTDSAKHSLSPNPRHQHPDPETALILSGFSSLTASQLSLNSGQGFVSNHQQEDVSEQTLEMMTSLPGHPLHPANLTFADSPVNQVYNLDLSPSSGPLDWNQPAHAVNTLSRQDEVLAPYYNVPFSLPHPASPNVEPTNASPDDFYPTNTMEIDWGSGDYLETLTFLDSDGEDYSPVTKVLSDAYQLEDYTESYDTAFPSRVGVSPSSSRPFRVSPTPSLSVDGTATPLKPIDASPSPSAVRYTLKPTPTRRIPHASDVDWTDAFTIHPTDVLLPDMNSLEYYTTQLNRENNSVEAGAKYRNASTASVSPTEIMPTSSFINDTAFREGGSSGDSSGFEPQEESSTVLTDEDSPRIKNTAVAFLDPSIVPTHFINPSSFSWDAEMSTTDWPTSVVTPGTDSTILPDLLLPTVTPLLSDSALPYSSLTDVHWFVTESVHRGSISSTLGLSSATALFPVSTTAVVSTTTETIERTPQDSTTEQIFNISLFSTQPTTLVTSPNILSDQGVTEDGADIPATLTVIPPRSDATTVSDIPVTTTATNTSHQAITTTTATAMAATNVNIMSTTSRKTPTTATAPRKYFCNIDRPVYLVKIGKNHLYNMYYYAVYFSDSVTKFAVEVYIQLF